MNKLRERFRQRLLGQLSDANTEVDINNAVDVCKDFSVSFLLFCVENYNYQGDDWWNRNYIDEALLSEELYNKFLEIYDKK